MSERTAFLFCLGQLFMLISVFLIFLKIRTLSRLASEINILWCESKGFTQRVKGAGSTEIAEDGRCKSTSIDDLSGDGDAGRIR